MEKKRIPVWVMAGSICAGSVIGITACAQQPDVVYYDQQDTDLLYDTENVQGSEEVWEETTQNWQEDYEDPNLWQSEYGSEPTGEEGLYPQENVYLNGSEGIPETGTEGYTENDIQGGMQEDGQGGRLNFEEEEYDAIRRGEGDRMIEDFVILNKEDAEADFDLPEPDSIPVRLDLNVPEILQEPELPTGCESVSLTMALNYAGFELEKTTIAREFLIYNRETENMAVGYIGDPFSEDGAGCFAPGIAATAENFFEDQEYEYDAYDITGTEMGELLRYLADDTPVILWSTMYMAQPEFTEEHGEYDGREYRWYRQEHCVVLSGYDLEARTLTINDPLEGIVTRDYEEFQQIYDEIGQYAVVLKAREEE